MRVKKANKMILIYTVVVLVLGIFVGMESARFFYTPKEFRNESKADNGCDLVDLQKDEIAQDGFFEVGQNPPHNAVENLASGENVTTVSVKPQTLYSGTEYVLEETDLVDQTIVERVEKLPDKYVGMNREQFLVAMESYAAFPPLSERARGFVNCEVVSFSRERVVVRMNYQYVQPSNGFYLGVYDHKIVVYLDDAKTIYIQTDIDLDALPIAQQGEVMHMQWIENERALYNFLENYSS